MGKFKEMSIAPVITKENLKSYKDDEFYKEHLEYVKKCKNLSKVDLELKYLTSFAEKTIELCFFSKHNCCEIIYDQESMLDHALNLLSIYIKARYDATFRDRFL